MACVSRPGGKLGLIPSVTVAPGGSQGSDLGCRVQPGRAEGPGYCTEQSSWVIYLTYYI